MDHVVVNQNVNVSWVTNFGEIKQKTFITNYYRFLCDPIKSRITEGHAPLDRALLVVTRIPLHLAHGDHMRIVNEINFLMKIFSLPFI